MKKLKIEKYIHNKLDESFTVPLGFIRIMKTLLPHTAIESMNQNGIDIEKILLASAQNELYQKTIECEEKEL